MFCETTFIFSAACRQLLFCWSQGSTQDHSTLFDIYGSLRIETFPAPDTPTTERWSLPWRVFQRAVLVGNYWWDSEQPAETSTPRSWIISAIERKPKVVKINLHHPPNNSTHGRIYKFKILRVKEITSINYVTINLSWFFKLSYSPTIHNNI